MTVFCFNEKSNLNKMQHDALTQAFKMLLTPVTFVAMSRGGRSGASVAHMNDLLAAQP